MEASEGRSTPESRAVMECGDGKAAEAWRRKTEKDFCSDAVIFLYLDVMKKIIGQKIRRISGNLRLPASSHTIFIAFSDFCKVIFVERKVTTWR